MRLMNGLLVLLLFQCAGEALQAYFQLSLPGPVIGMLLLFFGLCLLGRIPAGVAAGSQSLIPLLAIMFMPAAAGLFFLGPAFDDQWPAIVGAIVVATVLSLLFNTLLMRWLVARCR